ncbi:ribosome maturation factor RimP [Roseisolibacter sp. H3M3-2]|uniref:ribosome maturation factor RimP n=1 Tax=Roseisolibacter sp. H3M3-2 TaxID=3031323 RepID=UPI0023DCCCBE|nr:ribosome maturation factor RimP [Roseisolibacter sp. H3M3-2]MDF1502511.1 ribosome maturation factor RimP [Roseisolibacter sp. H3M3-2]
MPDALEHAVTAELETLGFELFELRRRGSKRRPVLDLRVERRDGAHVSVDDCARVSRAVEARLEADGLVGEQYVLEVSSPGIERPLRGPNDWRRFVGQPAVVTAPSLPAGKAEVTIVALDGEPGTEVAVVRDERGAEHRVPLAEVSQARLAFHWNK